MKAQNRCRTAWHDLLVQNWHGKRSARCKHAVVTNAARLVFMSHAPHVSLVALLEPLRYLIGQQAGACYRPQPTNDCVSACGPARIAARCMQPCAARRVCGSRAYTLMHAAMRRQQHRASHARSHEPATLYHTPHTHTCLHACIYHHARRTMHTALNGPRACMHMWGWGHHPHAHRTMHAVAHMAWSCLSTRCACCLPCGPRAVLYVAACIVSVATASSSFRDAHGASTRGAADPAPRELQTTSPRRSHNCAVYTVPISRERASERRSC